MSTTSDSRSAEAELREQVKVLGEKFLLRTAEHINSLRAHVAHLRGGDRETLVRMQELAHKIHGSGAMFGFAALSECAGKLERLIAAGSTGAHGGEPPDTGASPDRLSALVEDLAVVLEATLRKS